MYSLAEQIVALNIPWPTLHLHTKIAHLRTLVNPMDKTDYPLVPGSEIAEKIVMPCSQPKQSSCAFYFDERLHSSSDFLNVSELPNIIIVFHYCHVSSF